MRRVCSGPLLPPLLLLLPLPDRPFLPDGDACGTRPLVSVLRGSGSGGGGRMPGTGVTVTGAMDVASEDRGLLVDR